MGFDDDVFGSGPSDQSHVELPPTSDDLLGSLGSGSGRVDRSHPASPPPYGDLLGGLGTGERKDDLDQGSVNDLLPGFSSSVWPPQPEREAHETDLPKPPKQAPSVQDDPFGLFSDPLAEFTPSPSASGPTKVDSSPTAEDPSRESSENSVTGEDAWLTVSEIPLFTRIPLFTWPTSAPPPSRAPPPLTIKPKPRSNYSFNKDSSLVNDPEDFALGNPHPNKFEFDEGEMERSSAAMEDAMNKAEAKLRHAKEVREKMRREEAEQQEREDAEREIAEKEHEERDREDRERERRRIATEEEEKRRKEREERLAVERTTKEARERAAHEAKLRAEEVAVQRAQHEARERAAADRDQRSTERVQRALQEMNERDLQAQREQAERHLLLHEALVRIAESLDFEIKRWAAGKEGNLRALLSSLHYIMWQESGWQPVSLTDLINGADVKKEAWNKFNSEELF
ncbi:hypothetical protein FCM35_KLT04689 [Carex littledalei]|uniref:Uncharacterized protein n=1 Tax=Carex littledalei TaxID=544730 RepID=A0A833QWE5_9POAL|nr:hypothetical protein FCM35_KLT04689 [Carex littledalei]